MNNENFDMQNTIRFSIPFGDSVGKSENSKDEENQLTTSIHSTSTNSQEDIRPTVELSSEDVKHKILTEKSKPNIKSFSYTLIRDYLTIGREQNLFKNDPEWDSYEQCLMKDMIHSRKRYNLASDKLKKKRVEEALTRIETNKKIKEMEADERMFGASFIYYDKFVKENLEKRERAIETIKSEQAISSELDKHIEITDFRIKRLTAVKNDVVKCISDRKIFVDFLERVRVLAPKQFCNGVHEIAERYEVLTNIRQELQKEQADALETMQDLIREMFKMSDERTEELYKLRNKVSELYCRYDTAKCDALYWESIANMILGMTAEEKLQQSVIKNACYCAYLLTCRDRKVTPTVSKSDICKQLSFIEESIIMLRRALYLLRGKLGDEINKGEGKTMQSL